MRHLLNHAASSAIAVAVLVSLGSEASVAQESSADQVTLEEIVVTARKREESLQDVPLTVTAVGATQIQELGIRDARDLALYVPGFSNVASFGRNSSERPTIRGQSNILGSPNASYFIDGVFISGSATNTETANLERIEVIKGPQAALYGRATFAGAINYVTKRPADEFEGNVTATLGNFQQRDLTAYVSGPLVEGKLNYYLAATRNDIGGYYDNPLDRRDDLGAEQTEAVTAKFLWTPTDALEMTALFTWLEDDDGPPALGLQGREFNNCQLPDPVLRPRSRGYFCGEALPISKLVVQQLTDQMPNPGTQRERTRAALTASLELAGGYQLVSTSGYSQEDYTVQIDATYAGYVLGQLNRSAVPAASSAVAAQTSNDGAFQRIQGERRHDFSQELRLSSPAEARLRWSLGGYYFAASDDSIRDDKIYPNGGLIVPNGAASQTFRDITNSAWFGSLEYDLTEKLTVTAEARRAEEDVEQLSLAYPLLSTRLYGTTRTPSAPLSATFKSTTPRFTLRYKDSDDLTLFANYAEGTKPGGFNSGQAAPLLLAQGRPLDIKEEKSEVVEIGAKFNLGTRVRGSITAYNIMLTNQQLTQNIVGQAGSQIIATSFVENSGKTISRGIELELNARLGAGLDVGFGGSLIDAKFDEYFNSDQAALYSYRPSTFVTPPSTTVPVGCSPAAVCAANIALDNAEFGDVAGKRTPRSPEWNAYLVSRYTRPLPEGRRLVIGVDLTAEGSKYAQVHNLIETGDRMYLNARIGIESDRWNISLWGRNLNDDGTALDILRYVDGRGISSYFTGLATRAFVISLPKPRQVGVTATLKF